MKIDISAELLEVDSEQYYADWAIAEVQSRAEKTIVEIAVSGFADSDYLDLTPIFEILDEAEESVGDAFYISEVQFNPNGVVATIRLTSEDIRVDETISSFEVNTPNGRFYTLEEEVLSKVEYDDPPLLVGYCTDGRLSIE